MQYNVAQLLKSPPGTSRDYDIEEDRLVLDEGLTTVEPVKGRAHMQRTNRGVLVDGKVDTAVALECSRCVEPVVLPLALGFREEYVPTIDPTTGLPSSVTAEEQAFRIDEHHILDLTEAVRQYALTELPIQPLCSDKCKGLCPECGQNLNEAQCECNPVVSDARWAKLAELLEEAEEPEQRATLGAEEPRNQHSRRRNR